MQNSKEEIHKSYKTLIKVENAFKTLKTDYLEIRPLYLKTDKRIKGHLFTSMLAYNIVRRLKDYTTEANLDFKTTVRKLDKISTVINKVNDFISYEFIPKADQEMQKLFDVMKFKLPTVIEKGFVK